MLMIIKFFHCNGWGKIVTLSEAKLKLRREVLKILMSKYGHEGNNKAIYECANEWCEKQYTTNGLANYFKAYYTGEKYK